MSAAVGTGAVRPAETEVRSGLEGVVAFATEIAEPDREGGALRYRGVDIEELVGSVPFEHVWGLLVDGSYEPGLAPAEPHPLSVRSGDPRVDLQAALATLAPEWGLGQLIDISDAEARDALARVSVMALSFVAQSARGIGRPPVPQREIDRARSIPERFLLRWRGEADPRHAKAIDAYWISAAEHGMNASTFTARVVASTGADVATCLSAAVGALSGPLHGGAPSRVLAMLDEVEREGDPAAYVAAALDRGERLMGFGHRVYRAEDPRARVLLPHRARAGGAAARGRRGARARGARGARRAAPRPRARHQRRVLVGRGARLRRRAPGAVHADVLRRPGGRLVGARPRAEARGAARAPHRRLRRPGAEAGTGGVAPRQVVDRAPRPLAHAGRYEGSGADQRQEALPERPLEQAGQHEQRAPAAAGDHPYRVAERQVEGASLRAPVEQGEDGEGDQHLRCLDE
jgi:citrate synthase